jgi:hypothetical protein
MLEFGYILTDTRFAFHQMMDCIKYKVTHNLISVAFILVALYLLWRLLRPDVRGAR